MLAQSDIQKLIKLRLKDANALLQKKRYHGAIYMSGYAVELSLKNKICDLYQFTNGFPEAKNELQSYNLNTNQNLISLKTINSFTDIMNHDLNTLLTYSGEEIKIKQNYFPEWQIVFTWNPKMRYKIFRSGEKLTSDVLMAVAKIINAINK